MLKTFWGKVKNLYDQVATIVWARIQTIVGFAIAVVSAIDFSDISNAAYSVTGFDWKQAAFLGGALMLNGLFTEYLRRKNAKDIAPVI